MKNKFLSLLLGCWLLTSTALVGISSDKPYTNGYSSNPAINAISNNAILNQGRDESLRSSLKTNTPSALTPQDFSPPGSGTTDPFSSQITYIKPDYWRLKTQNNFQTPYTLQANLLNTLKTNADPKKDKDLYLYGEDPFLSSFSENNSGIINAPVTSLWQLNYGNNANNLIDLTTGYQLGFQLNLEQNLLNKTIKLSIHGFNNVGNDDNKFIDPDLADFMTENEQSDDYIINDVTGMTLNGLITSSASYEDELGTTFTSFTENNLQDYNMSHGRTFALFLDMTKKSDPTYSKSLIFWESTIADIGDDDMHLPRVVGAFDTYDFSNLDPTSDDYKAELNEYQNEKNLLTQANESSSEVPLFDESGNNQGFLSKTKPDHRLLISNVADQTSDGMANIPGSWFKDDYTAPYTNTEQDASWMDFFSPIQGDNGYDNYQFANAVAPYWWNNTYSITNSHGTWPMFNRYAGIVYAREYDKETFLPSQDGDKGVTEISLSQSYVFQYDFDTFYGLYGVDDSITPSGRYVSVPEYSYTSSGVRVDSTAALAKDLFIDPDFSTSILPITTSIPNWNNLYENNFTMTYNFDVPTNAPSYYFTQCGYTHNKIIVNESDFNPTFPLHPTPIIPNVTHAKDLFAFLNDYQFRFFFIIATLSAIGLVILGRSIVFGYRKFRPVNNKLQNIKKAN